MEVNAEELARFFDRVLPHLNERQRRVVAGAAAHLVGNKTASRLRQPISLTPPRDFATAGPGPLPSAGPLSVAITYWERLGPLLGAAPSLRTRNSTADTPLRRAGLGGTTRRACPLRGRLRRLSPCGRRGGCAPNRRSRGREPVLRSHRGTNSLDFAPDPEVPADHLQKLAPTHDVAHARCQRPSPRRRPVTGARAPTSTWPSRSCLLRPTTTGRWWGLQSTVDPGRYPSVANDAR